MENLSSLPTYIPSSDFFFMKFFHVEKRKNWSQIPCSLVGKKFSKIITIACNMKGA